MSTALKFIYLLVLILLGVAQSPQNIWAQEAHLTEDLQELRAIRKRTLPQKQWELSEKILKIYIEGGMPDSIEEKRQLMKQVDATAYLAELETMLRVPGFKHQSRNFDQVKKIIQTAHQKNFLSYFDLNQALELFITSNKNSYPFENPTKAELYFGRITIYPYFEKDTALEISKDQMADLFVHFQAIHELKLEEAEADGIFLLPMDFTLHDNSHLRNELIPTLENCTFEEVIKKEIIRSKINRELQGDVHKYIFSPFELFHEEIESYSSLLLYMDQKNQDAFIPLILSENLKIETLKARGLDTVFVESFTKAVERGNLSQTANIFKAFLKYEDLEDLLAKSPKIVSAIVTELTKADPTQVAILLKAMPANKPLYQAVSKDPGIRKVALRVLNADDTTVKSWAKALLLDGLTPDEAKLILADPKNQLVLTRNKDFANKIEEKANQSAIPCPSAALNRSLSK